MGGKSVILTNTESECEEDTLSNLDEQKALRMCVKVLKNEISG
jgi:hypothetical protein